LQSSSIREQKIKELDYIVHFIEVQIMDKLKTRHRVTFSFVSADPVSVAIVRFDSTVYHSHVAPHSSERTNHWTKEDRGN